MSNSIESRTFLQQDLLMKINPEKLLSEVNSEGKQPTRRRWREHQRHSRGGGSIVFPGGKSRKCLLAQF